MKIHAVIVADLERDFLGAPGGAAASLHGTPAMVRTVLRVRRLRGLSGLSVVCPVPQEQRCRQMLEALGTPVHGYAPAAQRCAVMRKARAFGRYGWRGGLADATIFDELLDFQAIGAGCNPYRPTAVMPVPGAAALLDAAWTQRVIDAFAAGAGGEFAFSQAPIGLSAAVFSLQFVNNLLDSRIHMGRVLGFDPHAPRLDMVFEDANVKLPDGVINTPYRFLADSPRGLWLCERLLERLGDEAGGEELCAAAGAMPPEPWPREVCIELTTRRSFPDALRPGAAPRELDLDRLGGALAGLEAPGDVNVMFEGLGDGLLHPRWEQAVGIARGLGGAVGLATHLASLDDDLPRRLGDSGLDVLQIQLDALSDAVYALTKPAGPGAAAVWEHVERLAAFGAERLDRFPFVVPTMLKTRAALGEQEAFYERCKSATGWGVIAEPSDYGGRVEFPGVFDMSPPTRTPCRRLGLRLAMAADGRILTCEEDFYGAGIDPHPEATLLSAWRGDKLEHYRRLHAQGRWDELDLCRHCREFHRA